MITASSKQINGNPGLWHNLLQTRKAVLLATDDRLKQQCLNVFSPEQATKLSKYHLCSESLTVDTQEIEELEALSRKNKRSLQKNHEAFRRLESGIYGKCLCCHEFISDNRLRAQPETRYCYKCEKDIEKKQMQTAIQNSLTRLQGNKVIFNFQHVLGQISVSDVMQENPITIKIDESVGAAMSLLSNNNIRHLPVLNSGGDLQGIISDRDLFYNILRAQPWEPDGPINIDWNKEKVDCFMTKTPERITPETNLIDAGIILQDNKFSCLPVMEGSQLVGIITVSDFVKLVSEA